MIEHNIPEMKLKKIDAVLNKMADDLVHDLKSFKPGTLDHLQMQTFIMGFHECSKMVKGVLYD